MAVNDEVLDQIVTTPVGLTNPDLRTWVDEMATCCASLTHVHWVDGSQEEYDRLCDMMVEAGTFIRLNPDKRPNSFLARSHPVRRRPRRGPHLHLLAAARRTPGRPTTGRRRRRCAQRCMRLFDGCMRGRTMYVIPFSMGPLGSPIAKIGVQITDSPYVVVNMQIMTRMGSQGARRARRRPVHPLHAFGRRAAGAGPAGRAVALRGRHPTQVHRAFPGDLRDLVVRLRLRRQRAARQEVPGAAHRLGDGAP